ncbi:MAG: hypothetical protein U0992_06305 [Planctomycetaceae bacterium]
MQALIASDDASTAERLRTALAAHRIDCPLSRVVSLDAAPAVAATGGIDLVLLVVSVDIDRAVQILQELRKRTKASLIVIGAARDPNVILKIVHTGPDDYLDIEDDLGVQLQRTLDRRRTSQPAGKDEGKLVTFVSHSGGSGCSFLATNLAVTLARLHGKCALCDFNLRRGDLSALLNLKPRYSISDLSRNVARLDQGMLEQSLLQHDSGVQLLAAPASLADVHPITSDVATQLLRLLRASFPFVVGDLEDFFHAEQIQLLRASSAVCFVLRLDFTALRNARRTLDYLEREGLDLSRVHIVVNQYGRHKELTVGQAQKVLSRKVSLFVPYDQKTVVSSLNRGVPVAWETPKSKIAQAIERIAEKIALSEPVAV